MDLNKDNQSQNNNIGTDNRFGNVQQQNFYQNPQNMHGQQYNTQYVQPTRGKGLMILIVILLILFMLCCCGLGGLYFIGKNVENNQINEHTEQRDDNQTNTNDIVDYARKSLTMADIIDIANANGYTVYNQNANESFNSISNEDYSITIDVYDYNNWSVQVDSEYMEEKFEDELYIRGFSEDGVNVYDNRRGDNWREVRFANGTKYYDIYMVDKTMYVAYIHDMEKLDELISMLAKFGY